MSPDRNSADANLPAGDNSERPGDPRVLLFMRPGRDRELLIETLGERYQVETTTDVEALDTSFDCCVFDVHQFNRVAGTVQARRDTSNPVFLPFVLLVGEDSVNDSVEVWEYVDDVIDLPVKKTALHTRIGNLVERRQTAVELARSERQLAETVEDLRLKERAMDEAPIGITIAEAGEAGEDSPLIYVNEQYENVTGYSSSVLGEDCRFLQGEETNEETVATIRAAIDAREPVSVDILNYRKNGQKFWNKLDVAPLHDDEGAVRNFVGFQTDITDRKIRERRLEVLNRVLSHNLRNKMNVIEGHTTLLRREYEGKDPPEALAAIERATADLIGLAEAVQLTERTLDASESTEAAIELTERLREVVSAFEDRFPDAAFSLTLPESGSCTVGVTGLVTAIEEAVENAVKHNDNPEPHVEITVERRPDKWVEVTITDNGPGMPSQELEVLQQGETPLRHADRLGIWLMYWIVSKAGGNFSVSEPDRGGTRLQFSVPGRDR